MLRAGHDGMKKTREFIQPAPPCFPFSSVEVRPVGWGSPPSGWHRLGGCRSTNGWRVCRLWSARGYRALSKSGGRGRRHTLWPPWRQLRGWPGRSQSGRLPTPAGEPARPGCGKARQVRGEGLGSERLPGSLERCLECASPPPSPSPNTSILFFP